MPQSPHPDSGLTAEKLEELRARLLKERQKLVDMYNHNVHAGRDIQAQGAEDSGDYAKMDDARDLLFSLSTSEREQLQQIDEALARIENGDYGICQHTGNPIPLVRLEAVPWARFCAEHQELAEQGLLEEE